MKKTNLDLKLEHLDSRQDKYQQLLQEVEDLLVDVLKIKNVKPSTKNIEIYRKLIKSNFKDLFMYSNYIAKKIPDFNDLPSLMIDELLEEDTRLDRVCSLYITYLHYAGIKYQTIEEWVADKNAKLDLDAKNIINAVEIDLFFDTVMYDHTALIDPYQRMLCSVTTKVEFAIETYYILCDYGYKINGKQFVIDTMKLLQKYNKFLYLCYPNSDLIPQTDRQAIKNLYNALERFKYPELKAEYAL